MQQQKYLGEKADQKSADFYYQDQRSLGSMNFCLNQNLGCVDLFYGYPDPNTLFRIDTSKLNSGVYAVQLQGVDLHYKTQKLIILK